MKRAIKIAAFAIACAGLCMPAAFGAGRSPQGSSTASSSTSAPKKAAAKKKKHHYSRRQPTQKAPTADRIEEIQSALARNGYYQGDPNGKWDSSTVAAMQKFQSDHGLDANGKLDARSLQKLGLGSDIAGVSAPRPITPGSTTPSTGPTSAAPKPVQPTQSSAAPSGSTPATSATLTQPKIPQR